MLLIPRFNITQACSFSDDEGIHFYCLPTFASVFDWLMEKGIDIDIRLTKTRYSEVESVMKCVERLYGWKVSNIKIGCPNTGIMDGELTWYEAANAAIKKALTLI